MSSGVNLTATDVLMRRDMRTIAVVKPGTRLAMYGTDLIVLQPDEPAMVLRDGELVPISVAR